MENDFASFKKNTKAQETEFAGKIGVFLLILIQIPILAEIILGDELDSIFALLADIVVVVGLILNHFKKTYLAAAIVSTYFYGLFSIVPYLFDVLTVSVPVILAVFIANIYVIKNKNYQQFNLLGAVIALCIFFNAASHIYDLNLQYFTDMAICTISFTVIFTVIFSFKRDVKRNQKKLEQNISFLKQITDTNPHFIYTTNNQHKFTFANKTMQGFDGKNKHNLIGKNVNEFWATTNNTESAVQQHENGKFDLKFFKNKANETRFHEVLQTPLIDADGCKIGNLGVSIDVTEKRIAQIKLEQSERNYKELFDNHQLAILMENDGKFIKVNDTFCKMTGYSKSEIIGKPISEIMHIDDYNATEHLVRQVEKNEVEGHSFEHRFVRKDQSIGHAIVHMHESSKMSLNDSFYRMATLTDISKLKTTEAALKESEAIYRTLVNNAYDGIEIHESIPPLEPNGKWTHRMILRNTKIHDLLGRAIRNVKKESFSFKDLLDMSPTYQRNGIKSTDVIKQLTPKLQKNKILSFEWQYGNHKNFVDTEMTVIRFKIGNRLYITSIYKDVTERKKGELKLQKSLKKIQRKNEKIQRALDSNDALEKFAFSVSHELKGPLRTITGYADLLKKSIENKEANHSIQFVNQILHSSKGMDKVIHKFLLFARLDTQKIEVVEVNLNELFNDIQNERRALIQKHKATIILKNLAQCIYADKTLFKHLIHNLISNAIKYSAPNRLPEIIIDISENNQFWEFEVQDNGMGIDRIHHKNIFDFFGQVDASSNKGTGIGLALCKKIVEHHQGEIGLISQVGKGSTFYFSIRKNLSNDI